MKVPSLIVVSLMFMTAVVQAEEVDLNKAFQSEYLYLVSQKEALLRQKQTMERNLSARANQAKATVTALQKELVHLTAGNDEAHENLIQLEKQKRELDKRGSSREATYKRAAKILLETERALQFDSSKDIAEITPPANLKTSDLAKLFDKANLLLEASARQETLSAAYLDSEGRLSQGQVTRVGRVAAFVASANEHLTLGPSGNGSLKVLKTAAQPEFYLFENLNETSKLQKAATWLETLADFSPLLFLGLMLALVAGLFSALIKV
jgi:biopolymer transport protein ExbB